MKPSKDYDYYDKMLSKLSPDQLDTRKKGIDKYLEVLKGERDRLVDRKRRFNNSIDGQIAALDKELIELKGESELIRVIVNDECPFEEGPVDMTIEEGDEDYIDDERLLLPMHLGGYMRTADEYSVPVELIPEDDYAMATVRPW